MAVHDPDKVVSDLSLSLALGGDCLADLDLLRTEAGVYGPVASKATVSRTVSVLAADARAAVAAVNRARAQARARAWALAGDAAPDHGISAAAPLVIDADATIVLAHSEKEQAAGTYTRTFGFHPLMAFLDHGAEGTGEPLAIVLRPGNAGSNTAADHVSVIKDALAQIPGINPSRPGRKILVRADGVGGMKEFTTWAHRRGVQYSVGFTLPGNTPDLLRRIPDHVWAPAYDADGKVRPGADVAALTALVTLTGWPPGMRVIARRERPHPGAQLRFEDVDGYRITAFATNTTRGQLADLELRHRRRARAEDRIRIAKDAGLTNLPLHGFDQNTIWCHLVLMGMELTAWTQVLALRDHPARRVGTQTAAPPDPHHPRDPGPHRTPSPPAPQGRRALRRPRPDRVRSTGRPRPSLTRAPRPVPTSSTPLGTWNPTAPDDLRRLVVPHCHNQPPTVTGEPQSPASGTR